MNLDAQQFLQGLARLPAYTFENLFATALTKLDLANLFDRNELMLLYEAADKARACNLAINEIGMRIRTENEIRRTELELEFMEARDIFFASPGWQNLNRKTRRTVEQIFLRVVVLNDRLAW